MSRLPSRRQRNTLTRSFMSAKGDDFEVFKCLGMDENGILGANLSSSSSSSSSDDDDDHDVYVGAQNHAAAEDNRQGPLINPEEVIELKMLLAELQTELQLEKSRARKNAERVSSLLLENRQLKEENFLLRRDNLRHRAESDQSQNRFAFFNFKRKARHSSSPDLTELHDEDYASHYCPHHPHDPPLTLRRKSRAPRRLCKSTTSSDSLAESPDDLSLGNDVGNGMASNHRGGGYYTATDRGLKRSTSSISHASIVDQLKSSFSSLLSTDVSTVGVQCDLDDNAEAGHLR